MAKYKDFCGFRFGAIHSSDLNLIVVSSSKRYEKNLLPPPNDYTSTVPGGDGDYYFGSTFKQREFVVNVAFNNISESDFRRISNVFSTDELQDLVFDELPYKTFKAKIKEKPDFKFVCFTDKESQQRVYKGEGNLKFISYFPYGFGFDKYVVRAADYYKCCPPENIITGLIDDNPYQPNIEPFLIEELKKHYNVEFNMNTPWKTGFPTIEQVQAGELYFIDPTDSQKKLLIDTRGYWRNIPEWENTAKLLTTPTLDYDQELIYLPQYNRLNYMNMDTGLNQEQGLIGSRILVYNPGDIPVDFEIKMGNLKKRFRANEGDYRFRVSRYNVQRLPIPCAVDWTQMKTESPNEEEIEYKYGNRYFKVLDTIEENGHKTVVKKLLKGAHPHHAYYVEPIPKEQLAHFIKMFYWQSFKLNILTHEEFLKGVRIAKRYEELYKSCINEMEKYELYWKTLKDAILEQYKKQYFSDNEDLYEKFVYNYFQCPPEYYKEDGNFNHKYGQFDFNLSRLPQYLTNDYFEITTKDLWDSDSDSFEPSQWTYDSTPTKDTLPHSLYLNSEKRMLYNIKEPDWDKEEFSETLSEYGKDKLWDEYEDFDNFYNYSPTKEIRNESILKGHWFKLPPGWSLIDISPVIDETRWGGKLWRDGRPFEWGNVDEDLQNEIEPIYEQAVRDYLKSCYPYKNPSEYSYDFNTLKIGELEELIQFRRWYGEESAEDVYTNDLILKDDNDRQQHFINTFIHKLNEDAEYGFLKLLCSYWNVTHLENGKITKDNGTWWWYASMYLWANFPPLYWGYMDLLNELQIKYVPLFY